MRGTRLVLTCIKAVAAVASRLGSGGAVELAGMAAIVYGVHLVYDPAAFVLAGVAIVFWAQGREEKA